MSLEAIEPCQFVAKLRAWPQIAIRDRAWQVRTMTFFAIGSALRNCVFSPSIDLCADAESRPDRLAANCNPGYLGNGFLRFGL